MMLVVIAVLLLMILFRMERKSWERDKEKFMKDFEYDRLHPFQTTDMPKYKKRRDDYFLELAKRNEDYFKKHH